jgi:spermidine/putrescine transport system ATP-binding protein
VDKKLEQKTLWIKSLLRRYVLENVTVQVKDVVKRFGEVVAVDHVSLEIFAGEFFSILGPSGCGKTSLLRLLAGLEEPDSGEIFLDGKLINNTPSYRRDVNMVFQNYALFPHMNVYDNIAFGLKIKKVRKDEIDYRVPKALELVALPGMASRRPGQLSGGEKQRIALARALVNEPSVLLLDEPLGALDLKLRKEMQIELKSLQKRLGMTFVYVTHDQEEALTMSDRIAVMRSGSIEQLGTPSQVYEEPKTEFVANFIGVSNLFSGYQDGDATIMIRPEKIQMSQHKPEGDVNILRGKIEQIIYLGTVIQFIVDVNGKKLIVLDRNYSKVPEFKESQEVFVYWDISNTVVLSGSQENAERP